MNHSKPDERCFEKPLTPRMPCNNGTNNFTILAVMRIETGILTGLAVAMFDITLYGKTLLLTLLALVLVKATLIVAADNYAQTCFGLFRRLSGT